jgi:hypothetical protein
MVPESREPELGDTVCTAGFGVENGRRRKEAWKETKRLARIRKCEYERTSALFLVNFVLFIFVV